MLNENILLVGTSGVLISLEIFNIRKHYLSVNSRLIKNHFSFLLLITVINIALIILSLISGLYTDFFYSWAILIGMMITLIGDFNNKSINSTTEGFILGTIIFLFVYLSYTIGLIYTSGEVILPFDFMIITSLILSYIYLVKSSWGCNYFQKSGRYKIIINLYPIMLLFLLSLAISNFFQSTLSQFSVFMVTIGIILIFIIDMEYSFDKFFHPLNHLIGPILYPLGQLAIVLSTINLF